MVHGRTHDRLMGALEHRGRYGGEVRVDRRLDSAVAFYATLRSAAIF